MISRLPRYPNAQQRTGCRRPGHYGGTCYRHRSLRNSGSFRVDSSFPWSKDCGRLAWMFPGRRAVSRGAYAARAIFEHARTLRMRVAPTQLIEGFFTTGDLDTPYTPSTATGACAAGSRFAATPITFGSNSFDDGGQHFETAY